MTEPSDISLLNEYADFVKEYSETMKKLDDMDQSGMNKAELAYYIEVTSRVNKKLLEIT